VSTNLGAIQSELFSQKLRDKFEVYEWRHAITILKHVFTQEFDEIDEVLSNFELRKSSIVAGGGGKSKVSGYIDGELYSRDWTEKQFKTSVKVDEEEFITPTHKVDCVKGKIALDIEWNNKTEFYDRDLNNFRLLYNLKAISLGIIVTRTTRLQTEIFKPLGIAGKYGSSTTHLNKLLPKIDGDSAAGCPLIVFAVKPEAYVNDM